MEWMIVVTIQMKTPTTMMMPIPTTMMMTIPTTMMIALETKEIKITPLLMMKIRAEAKAG